MQSEFSILRLFQQPEGESTACPFYADVLLVAVALRQLAPHDSLGIIGPDGHEGSLLDATSRIPSSMDRSSKSITRSR